MATQFAVDLLFRGSGADRELKKLQGGLSAVESKANSLQRAFDRQKQVTKDVGKELLATKREYERLTNAIKVAARAGEDTSKLIAAARKAKDQVGQLRKEFELSKRAASAYKNELDKAASSAGRFGTAVNGLKRGFRGLASFKGLIAGLGFGLLAKNVFSATAEFERYEKQLTTLTGTAGRAKAVIDQLDQINRKSPFDLPQLIRTSKTLSAMGIGYEKLVDTTERLGKVSAATGARVEEVALAYGQVAAKGKLQTEELYQFQERGIALGEELKRMLGLTGDELQEMISKGQIGFPLVEKAIQNLTGETGKFKDAFENTADTLDAKLSNMQSDFKKAAAALGNAFRPVFIWLLEQATKIANFLTDAINHFQRGAAGVEGVEKANAAADKLTRQKYGQMGLATMAFNPEVQKFWDQARKSALDNFNRQIDIKQGRRTVAPSVDAVPSTTPAASAAEIAANRQLLLQKQKQKQKQNKTGGGQASSFKPSSRAQALIAAAKKLGVSPLDLATIISYETAGTFSPSIYGGAGGNYMGLIQFGGPERRQYGAHAGQSFEEQVQGPVVRFFQDRFAGVGRSTQGASLLDLYKTVNGGNPNVSAGLSDGNGTIGGHVQNMMGGHRQKALSTFFGGSEANVGYDAADAGQNAAEAWAKVVQSVTQAREAIASITEKVQLQTTDLETQLLLEQQKAQLLASAGSLESIEREFELRKGIQELETQRLAALQELQGIASENLLADEEIKTKEEEITAEFEKQKALLEQLQGLRNQNADAATARAAAEKNATASAGEDGAARGIASTLAGGLKNALVTAIKGGDVREAFAQLAENLANKFLDLAFKQIEDAIFNALSPQQAAASQQMSAGNLMGTAAQQQVMAGQNMLQAATMMQSMGGGGGFNLGGLGGLFSSGGSIGSFGSPFSAGAFSGGFGPGAFSLGGFFAEGGYVTGPTTAMIGEGGESEYVIPASKMGAAMSRYSRGARGESVIPGSGETAEGGGGTIDVSYSVVSINEQRFVTEEQFRAGIDSAAKRGAAGGHARSMSTLRNSRSQRTKLGL